MKKPKILSLKSKLIQNLLLFFFINPFAKIYLRELSRILEVKPQNLHKELKELEAIGLFLSEPSGKERYYSLNLEWPLQGDYRNIIKKTVGVPSTIAERLKTIRYIGEVYIKKNDPFDVQQEIEIIILQNTYNNPSRKAISSAMQFLEKELQRGIKFSFQEAFPSEKDYSKIL